MFYNGQEVWSCKREMNGMMIRVHFWITLNGFGGGRMMCDSNRVPSRVFRGHIAWDMNLRVYYSSNSTWETFSSYWEVFKS